MGSVLAWALSRISQRMLRFVGTRAQGGDVIKWIAPNGTLWVQWTWMIFGREWTVCIASPKWRRGDMKMTNTARPEVVPFGDRCVWCGHDARRGRHGVDTGPGTVCCYVEPLPGTADSDVNPRMQPLVPVWERHE